MLAILFILNSFLVVMTIIFAIKNIIIKFKEVKSRLKRCGLTFFIIITLVLSSIGSVSAMIMEENTNKHKFNVVSGDNFIRIGDDGIRFSQKEESQKQLNLMNSKKVKVLIVTILGYLFYACLWALHKNIIKEISETKITGGWGQIKYKA